VHDSWQASHLCGTRDCFNGDHIVVESKELNESRKECQTHPYFVYMEFELSDGRIVRQEGDYICKHEPSCMRRYVRPLAGTGNEAQFP